MSKREEIAALIEAGGATKESLMEAVDTNSAGLSSQFTYLRLTGRYPLADEDGVFKFIDKSEWDAMKEAALTRRATAAPKKSPEERLEALQKRVAKLQAAAEKRDEAVEKNDTELNQLKAEKAAIELSICALEITAVEEELEAAE